MKPVIIATLLTLFLVPRLTAQIYADFSISQDGEPLGSFRVLLHHETVPRPVANFVGLATGERKWISPASGMVQDGVPYYDGLTFHRLIHDFMIQGGDPLGTGTGGAGYVFQDQYDPSLRHSGSYVVSMANSGMNSNGSQFFITFVAAAHLDDLHSVFGTVIDDTEFPNGQALIDSLRSDVDFPTDGNDRPLTPLTIDSVVISGPDVETFDIDDPALGLPEVNTVSIKLRHDGEEDAFFLEWDRQRKWDYPVYFGDDLESWTLAGNLLSMDDETGSEIGVSGLLNEGNGFLVMSAIDYGLTPDIPVDIFETGDSLILQMEGGELTLLFDGEGAGSWSFEEEGGSILTGEITSYSRPESSTLFGIPDTGLFTSPSTYSYARSLNTREVVIFLDGLVGPYGIDALQPQISFHTASTGWYNGPVRSDSSLSSPFRGTFEWIPAAAP